MAGAQALPTTSTRTPTRPWELETFDGHQTRCRRSCPRLPHRPHRGQQRSGPPDLAAAQASAGSTSSVSTWCRTAGTFRSSFSGAPVPQMGARSTGSRRSPPRATPATPALHERFRRHPRTSPRPAGHRGAGERQRRPVLASSPNRPGPSRLRLQLGAKAGVADRHRLHGPLLRRHLGRRRPRHGMQVYDSTDGGWVVVGGTSEATPLIAAYYALIGSAAQGPWWAYANASLLNEPVDRLERLVRSVDRLHLRRRARLRRPDRGRKHLRRGHDRGAGDLRPRDQRHLRAQHDRDRRPARGRGLSERRRHEPLSERR